MLTPGAVRGAGPPLVSPLSSWFADAAAIARVRRRLGRAPVLLRPRDAAWRSIAPGFHAAVSLTASGLPFQLVAERRYDRSPDPRRVSAALAAGGTLYFPQIHQVLPRLMRLIVALRTTFLGAGRAECSFLFAVEGHGRAGMGLHHDGEVDAFWLQLAGRRTVTIGPPVPPRTPADLDDALAESGPAAGWRTLDLDPGTLLYLPPRVPHRVLCRRRSLALSLTWGKARRAGSGGRPGTAGHRRQLAARLVSWDVVSGRVDTLPAVSRTRLWGQVPAVAGPVDRRRGEFPLWSPGAAEVWLPAAGRPLARQLAVMPAVRRETRGQAGQIVTLLLEHGILAPHDLPLRVIPDAPAALDGWSFA